MPNNPISRETLIELRRLVDTPFPKGSRPLVAEEDEDGIVHLSDADTGRPRMHMPREVFDDLLAYKPPEPCAWDDDVVTFEMAIHKEEAAKIAAILRKLDEEDPQLAAAIENLADVLSAVSVVP